MSERFDNISTSGNYSFNDQQFLHVESAAQLKESELFDADAIVIESSLEKEILEMIQRIRTMRFKNFYLKPIFLSQHNLPDEVVKQTDGIMDFTNLEKIIQRTGTIRDRIREVNSVNDRYTFKESALVKTLQYLYTREVDLKPIRSRNASIGYIFPFLNNIVSAKETHILLDVLKKGQEEGWLENQVIDKVNLCKSCYGGYLNFRESCTSCHSIDLKTVELIHHFRCAYIGPATDFAQNNQLVCPKCDKELRHIGIDYDKPSEINECNNCGHQSQETMMKALCVDCGTENELQHLQTRAINNFQMTVYGRDLALNGLKKFDEHSLPADQDKRIISYQIWELLRQHEIARMQLSRSKSKISMITLKEDVLTHLDQTSREKIMKEFLLILSHYLRTIDFICAKDLNTFLILLPEIKDKEIAALKEVFEYNIQKLLGDNIGTNKPVIEAIDFFDINAELRFPGP